jgi:hypothetical protein
LYFSKHLAEPERPAVKFCECGGFDMGCCSKEPGGLLHGFRKLGIYGWFLAGALVILAVYLILVHLELLGIFASIAFMAFVIGLHLAVSGRGHDNPDEPCGACSGSTCDEQKKMHCRADYPKDLFNENVPGMIDGRNR